MKIPESNEGTRSIVASLKKRFAKKWRRELWKHIVRVIIEDIRVSKSQGRWMKVLNLMKIRKEYSFLYSKMLRRSAETGNFIFNVNAKVSPKLLLKLFQYEMILPLKAIMKFRALANMICIVELINTKRKESREKAKRNNTALPPFDRTNITFVDIVHIQMTLDEIENQRLFSYSSDNNNDDDDDDNDTESQISTDSKGSKANSVTSSSSRSEEKKGFISGIFGKKESSPNPNQPTPKASSMASTAKSMMGSSILGKMGMASDDLDNSVFGKGGVGVLGDFLSGLESEDRASDSQDHTDDSSSNMELNLTDTLGGTSPTRETVVSAINWTIARFKVPLSVALPDVSISIDSADVSMRLPVENNKRKDILTASFVGPSVALTISRAGLSNSPGGEDLSPDKAQHGFARYACNTNANTNTNTHINTNTNTNTHINTNTNTNTNTHLKIY